MIDSNNPNAHPTPTYTPKVWEVCIETLIDLTNAMEVTQYHNQGWTFHDLDSCYSGMIRADRIFEVERDFGIEGYIEALKSCPGINILWYEEKKGGE